MRVIKNRIKKKEKTEVIESPFTWLSEWMLPRNTTMSIVGFVLFSLHLQYAKFNNKLDLTEN